MSKRSKSRGKGKQDKAGEEKETLAYKVLSAEHTTLVSELDDVDQLQDKLEEILKLHQHKTDLKEAAILDYYVAGVWWAKEQGFTLEQTSAFFTVLHTVLNNVKENQMTLVDNVRELKKMFVGIGLETTDVSGGLSCFNVEQAKAITNYMHISIFQHYKMYEFMFSHTQAEEIIGTDLEVDLALPSDMPWPPPLDEGLDEDTYMTYLATPPATPETQAEDTETANREDADAEGDAATDLELQKEADLLSQLTPEEVKCIMDEVFEEMIGGLKDDVAAKLREKENAFIARINKIHIVAQNEKK